MRTNDKGLTLIELITVLSILAVTVLITLPTTNFFKAKISHFRLNMIANELINDIRYVQQKNIYENEKLYLSIQTDHSGYYINKPGTMSKRIKTKILPDGITIYSNNSMDISFSDQGAPISGGCTIYLYNSNKKIEITILPATGRVMIKGNY
ncbi:prepilin-type N-terminal cleavage/methylation domain-containing protein [Thermoanaerobacterium sp. RBIITD]|uniref:prepilin-type N-terminal cleavage/methylation domain-containing protein n=1 Tax=Thermoanaerobacterium sp. RBIITD TaxID=1550240 RepID=UPI000BB76660|nr:prepilin-type N-terminal cleavage/methylation domain-containing protein [Thermoanaerobacterium sp. RBIITD]SNX55343.1 prepilin-type N-terminal cleavage/methylation domain-containing protein [Thermoanaerobacterium sp. RBIITD]